MIRKHYRRKPYNITELAEKHGIKICTLRARLDKGIPIEVALTTPLEPRNTPMAIEYNGKVQSLKAWSRELGIHYETLRTRIENGWSIEDVLTKKVRATHYEIKYGGETLNLKQFSNKIGMDRHIVSNLLKKGFTPEEIAECKHSLCRKIASPQNRVSPSSIDMT